MADGRILLDTNVAIAFLGGDEAVRQQVADNQSIALSVLALGELYFGARRSRHVEENLRRIESFVAKTPVLEVNASTAHHYGNIKQELRSQGTPIPDNDLWIAALSRQHSASLATRDNQFDYVKGLKLLNW